MIRSEIGGVPVPELVERFGTPFYAYHKQTIETRIGELSSRFPAVRYAQKANPHLAILDLAQRSGLLVDAVSAGEIIRARKAGFAVDRIMYTADVFDDRALEVLRDLPVPVNCGSPDMIRQFADLRPKGSVTLRINPGFGHGHSRKTDTGGPSSKHGIWFEDLSECSRIAKECGVTIEGLHMHIGSGSDFDHLSKVGDAMVALDAGSEIKTISAGGGLPTPYRPPDVRIDLDRYREIWEEHRKKFEQKIGHSVELEIEPGRYLVAEAGYLVARIWAVKKTPSFLFYLVDTGFNHLIRPAMYGAYHPMSVCPADGREIEESAPVVVAGPLCESGDVFTQEAGGVVTTQDLPKAEVGDYLVIGCAGAYGRTMASNYNSHPFPAEVWLDDGNATLITPRQNLEALFADERIP
jgi:diaminopimelate decarboxylase